MGGPHEKSVGILQWHLNEALHQGNDQLLLPLEPVVSNKVVSFLQFIKPHISGFARVCHTQVMLQHRELSSPRKCKSTYSWAESFSKMAENGNIFPLQGSLDLWNLRRWQSMKFTGFSEFAEDTAENVRGNINCLPDLSKNTEQIATVLLQLSQTVFD